jgi:hypothetical protein
VHAFASSRKPESLQYQQSTVGSTNEVGLTDTEWAAVKPLLSTAVLGDPNAANEAVHRIATAEKLRLNPRKTWYSNLEEVTTNGEYEVAFRLKRPQPSFLALLASSWSPVYPCHVSPRDMRDGRPRSHSSLLTRCWRELDSNHRFLATRCEPCQGNAATLRIPAGRLIPKFEAAGVLGSLPGSSGSLLATIMV